MRATPCAIAALLLFVACHGTAGSTAQADVYHAPSQRTVIMIGFDGFARRYLDQDSAPALHAFAREGVTGKGMIPSFPSVTFPNFYALATGLYPDHSGIVNNSFVDPAYDSAFGIRKPLSHEGHWWGGEPIWVTASKQGVKSATMFWVGSDATKPVQPTRWHSYDRTVTFANRMDSVLTWLDLPGPDRPRLLMAYFEEPDHTGHSKGPDAPETRAAVLGVDSALAQLVRGLEQRKLYDSVDIVIVADHGMAEISPARTVYLDDAVDSANVNVVSMSPLLLISARDGNQEALLDQLKKLPHMQAWKKGDMPARMHYGTNARITPLVGLADPGWMIGWKHAKPLDFLGEHGYDNEHPDMRALFLARGPDFKAGSTLAVFPNVDVYDLVSHLLGVTPAPNDGTLAPFAPVLR